MKTLQRSLLHFSALVLVLGTGNSAAQELPQKCTTELTQEKVTAEDKSEQRSPIGRLIIQRRPEQRSLMPSIIDLNIALVCAAMSCPALAQSEPDEIDQYLAEHMKNVVVVLQVTDKHGQLISCVDIDHQPGTNHPSFAGSVHRELSPPGKATFERTLGPIVPPPPSELCPAGSVAMILPTRERIVHAGGLRRFMSKSPDGGGSVAPLPSASSTGLGPLR